MIARAYSRCNSGHYFVGENCPWDGWSSAASKELTRAVEALSHLGRQVSIEELHGAGVSETTLLRTIVVQFGSDGSAFDAINPKMYFIDEQAKTIDELDENFW